MAKRKKTPVPANDLNTNNVTSIFELRRKRQLRRTATRYVPPDRLLVLAILRALSLRGRKKDRELIGLISSRLTDLTIDLDHCPGCDEAERLFETFVWSQA